MTEPLRVPALAARNKSGVALSGTAITTTATLGCRGPAARTSGRDRPFERLPVAVRQYSCATASLSGAPLRRVEEIDS